MVGVGGDDVCGVDECVGCGFVLLFVYWYV